MQLVLTVSNLNPGANAEIQQVPRLEFSAAQNDYWVLLPFFEKVEEATGKLIDLGESVEFEQDELDHLIELIDAFIKDIPEPDEELILQDDGELLNELLDKLRGMARIAIMGHGKLTATSSES